MNNIVLCGFMGCGKTGTGKALSEKLGKPFIDTDQYIEQHQGMTVSQIFDLHGEGFFRDLEHEACLQLGQMNGAVIATGGGALTFERNAEAFRDDTVIFLDVNFEEIERRIGNSENRPLFKDREKARKLFYKRLPEYKRAADHTVDSSLSAKSTADMIIKLLRSEELL